MDAGDDPDDEIGSIQIGVRLTEVNHVHRGSLMALFSAELLIDAVPHGPRLPGDQAAGR